MRKALTVLVAGAAITGLTGCTDITAAPTVPSAPSIASREAPGATQSVPRSPDAPTVPGAVRKAPRSLEAMKPLPASLAKVIPHATDMKLAQKFADEAHSKAKPGDWSGLPSQLVNNCKRDGWSARQCQGYWKGLATLYDYAGKQGVREVLEDKELRNEAAKAPRGRETFQPQPKEAVDATKNRLDRPGRKVDPTNDAWLPGDPPLDDNGDPVGSDD